MSNSKPDKICCISCMRKDTSIGEGIPNENFRCIYCIISDAFFILSTQIKDSVVKRVFSDLSWVMNKDRKESHSDCLALFAENKKFTDDVYKDRTCARCGRTGLILGIGNPPNEFICERCAYIGFFTFSSNVIEDTTIAGCFAECAKELKKNLHQS